MSMPKFPDKKDILTREEALNAIIMSIAMEEAALARILTAESEKIGGALNNINWERKKDRELILCINKSAAQVIERIADLQMVLKNKLRLVTDCMPCTPAPCPKPCPCPCPPVPPIPPKPKPKPCKCVNKFCADSKYAWSPCRTLQFCHMVCCEDGVRSVRLNSDFMIILPTGKRYDIDISLRMVNQTRENAVIELSQIVGCSTIFSKEYNVNTQQINIHDKLTLFAEGHSDSHLSLRLQSQNPLEIKQACIEINSR